MQAEPQSTWLGAFLFTISSKQPICAYAILPPYIFIIILLTIAFSTTHTFAATLTAHTEIKTSDMQSPSRGSPPTNGQTRVINMTTMTITVSADTELAESTPDTNLGTDSKIDNNEKGGGDNKRAIFQWDLSSIPSGATVTSAIARFYTQKEGNAVNVHRITSPWTENGATWNGLSPAFDATTTATLDLPAKNVFNEVDLTPLVADWLDGTAANYGIMFRGTPGVNDKTSYRTKEHDPNLAAQLVVQYTGGSTPAVFNAERDLVITPQDTPTTIYPLANDSIPTSITPTITLAVLPVHGVATVNVDNTIDYTPAGGYNGTDALTYQVSDGNGGTDSALVNIVVDAPGNSAPDAQADSHIVAQNTTVDIDILDNDIDSDGDALTAAIITLPQHGTAQINPDNTLSYTPTLGYIGRDTFRYQVDDGNGEVDTALVHIIVDGPLNDAPDAQDDQVSVQQNSRAVIAVLTNDSDIDGDPLSVSIATPPLHGDATVNVDGTLVYTPTTDYAGPELIIYSVDDGQGRQDSALVYITVDPFSNNAPVAVDDIVVVPQNSADTVTVLGNDRDDDGDPLRVVVTTPPTNGSAVVNSDGSVRYLPTPGFSGTDTFVYRLEDGNGGEDWAVVQIFVDAPGNSPPTALGDQVSTTQNAPLTIDVLGNDLDTDVDPLLVTITTPPSNGSAAVNPDGTLSYTPTLNYAGPDSLTYQIDDGSSTASAVVSITVDPRTYNCRQISDISGYECDALVELYRTTDGPHWANQTNWLTTDSACGWFGVLCDGSNQVIELALDSNQLVGTLPCSIGQLVALQELSLSDNQLSGPLACELAQLVNLQELDLSQNQFSGEIPTELGALAQLQELFLHANQLSGPIPPALGNLTSLQQISLHQNQLVGTIPSVLGNLPNLTLLNLRENQFNGSIPLELAQLTALTTLDLGYNALALTDPTTTDPTIVAFLNNHDPDWQQTQTVAPMDLTVTPLFGPIFQLDWTPIPYTGDGGGYTVSYAKTPNGPFIELGNTTDKSASSYTVSGLDYEITYYFRVETLTPPHGTQQNKLWSEANSTVPANHPVPTPISPPVAQLMADEPIPAPYDLSVAGVEFNQAVQTVNNDVPLVAGKPLIARMTVGVSGTGNPVDNVQATLRAFRNGVELPDSPQNAFNEAGVLQAKLSPDRTQILDTLNFSFPTSWLAAGDLTLEATVNPGQTDQDNSNNKRTFTLTLHEVPPLEIVLIPIAFQPGGSGPIYRPKMDASTNFGLGFLQEMYPVPDVNYTIHSELHVTENLYEFSGWQALLNQIRAIRDSELADPRAVFPKYYGVVQVEAGCCLPTWPVSPASPIGGLGNFPGGAAVGIEGTEYFVDFSGDGQPDSPTPLYSLATHMASHEIGHTLGLGHAPCNTTGEAGFPHNDGSVGEIGLYIPDMTLITSSKKDVMSYCFDMQNAPSQWISVYNYNRLFEKLTGLAATSSVNPSRRVGGARPLGSARNITLDGASAWLVSGKITVEPISGTTVVTGTIDKALTVTSTAILTNTQACYSYEVRLLDDNGVSLFSHYFEPDPVNADGGESIAPPPGATSSVSGTAESDGNFAYGIAIPKKANASRIQLWRGGEFLDEIVVASAKPSLTASEVISPNDISISWNASDPNDTKPPIVTIRYSSDGGQTWTVIAPKLAETGSLVIPKSQLAFSANGLIEVIAHNSTEPVSAQLEIGAIENNPPKIGILGESLRTYYEGEAIILSGEGFDFEDGALSNEQFHWNIPALETDLGVGTPLVMGTGLPEGVYTVTLVISDQHGLASKAQVQLQILSTDGDGDEIDNLIEDAAPNNGDGNGDGVLDSAQANVASFLLPDGRGYVTTVVTGGCNTIDSIRSMTVADLPAQNLGYTYPYGLAEMRLACNAVGDTAYVTTYWHTASSQVGEHFQKFGPMTPGGPNAVWYDYPVLFGTAQVSGTVVQTSAITLTDGEWGDDTVADGSIVDPGGPAMPALLLSKRLNSPAPIRLDDPISFTITITNMDTITVTSLPLSDFYNTAYLTFISATTTPDDPTNDGSLSWADLTTSFGQDLGPNQIFSITALFRGIGDTTLLTNSETVNRASIISGSLHITADASVEIIASTALEVMQMYVVYTQDRATLHWETGNENQLVGFHVYRRTVQRGRRQADGQGEWVQLTTQLIQAKNAGETMGTTYAFEDRLDNPEMAVEYRLGLQYVDGQTRFFEPEEDVVIDTADTAIFLPLVQR